MLKWSCDAISLVSAALVVATASLLPSPLTAAVASIELAFAAFSAYRHAAHDSSVAPQAQVADGLRLFSRLLDPAEGHLRLLQSCRFLSEWFMGAEPSQLGTHNISEFLAYTLFNSHPRGSPDGSAASHSSALQLEELLRRFLAAAGLNDVITEEGTRPGARFMAHLRDPLRVSYRPLGFYVLMEIIALSSFIRLRRSGFRHVKTTKFCTFYVSGDASSAGSVSTSAATQATNSPAAAAGIQVLAMAAATAAAAAGSIRAFQPQTEAAVAATAVVGDDNSPIIFLHGIGVGLAPYVGFLCRLAVGKRPVYGVQYKHVSMRLTSAIPSPSEVADDVLVFMNKRGIAKATVVAHSYGTLVAASLCKRFGDRVASATLIDPVCFALFLPNLIKNSLYHHLSSTPEPFSLNHLFSLRSLMKGVVVRDLHCAVAMCRKFVWGDVNLWPSEMPRCTTIVLSGRDNLVPVEEVREILGAQRQGLDIMYKASHGHGAFVLDLDWQARIVSRIIGSASSQAVTATTRGIVLSKTLASQRTPTCPPPAPASVHMAVRAPVRVLTRVPGLLAYVAHSWQLPAALRRPSKVAGRLTVLRLR